MADISKLKKPILKLKIPDPKLLANRIADLVRTEIISGKFPLGRKLIEEELSSMLEVSRTPIRQAFHILQLEGLIELIPRRGAFVCQLTPKDAEELYQSLGMIESFVAEQLITDGQRDFSPLGKAVSFMAKQMEKGNLKGIIQGNFSFHQTLVKMAGNQRIMNLYQTVRNPTRVFQSMGLSSPRDWKESIEDHRRITAAISRGDTRAAVHLCRAHNLKGCRRVISHLSQLSQKKDGQAIAEIKGHAPG
jgi:DNA-binding GntR family transcriptional regulator